MKPVVRMSTATPEKLPGIEDLRRLTKSLAMLDAILSPDWEYRSYSYNAKWGPGEEMASMRNGCGDDWFLLFDGNGAALKGCAHEYPLAGDRDFAALIQEMVPPAFSSFLKEPAFSMERATFCLWRSFSDPAWNVVRPPHRAVSPEDDGSAELIEIFDGAPATYHTESEAYHERTIPLEAVQAIYRHEPLKEQLVASLNADCLLADLVGEALEIGYPAGESGGGRLREKD
ncbi:MAG TPA: hypothetical protein VN794_08075 [Methylomirabilota bacterium]|nr:hypothetical protein [Methylomirabilota bacterium]